MGAMTNTCETCQTVNTQDVEYCEGCGAHLWAAAASILPTAPVLKNAQLTIKSQGQLTKTIFTLGGTSLTLGRFDPISGPVDLDLTGVPGSETISRLHAEVYYSDGAWHVKDLGSTNGVFIKAKSDASFGPRLLAPAHLVDGDEIALGNARLVLTLIPEEAAPCPPSD